MGVQRARWGSNPLLPVFRSVIARHTRLEAGLYCIYPHFIFRYCLESGEFQGSLSHMQVVLRSLVCRAITFTGLAQFHYCSEPLNSRCWLNFQLMHPFGLEPKQLTGLQPVALPIVPRVRLKFPHYWKVNSRILLR